MFSHWLRCSWAYAGAFLLCLIAVLPASSLANSPNSRWRFESDHRAAELEPDHGL